MNNEIIRIKAKLDKAGNIIQPIDKAALIARFPDRPELGFIQNNDAEVFILPRPARPEDPDKWAAEVKTLTGIPPAYPRAKVQRRCINRRAPYYRVVKTPVNRIIGRDKKTGETIISPKFHKRHLDAVNRLIGLVSIQVPRIDANKSGAPTLSYISFPAV